MAAMNNHHSIIITGRERKCMMELLSRVKAWMIELCATVFTREFPTSENGRKTSQNTKAAQPLQSEYMRQNKIKIKIEPIRVGEF